MNLQYDIIDINSKDNNSSDKKIASKHKTTAFTFLEQLAAVHHWHLLVLWSVYDNQNITGGYICLTVYTGMHCWMLMCHVCVIDRAVTMNGRHDMHF